MLDLEFLSRNKTPALCCKLQGALRGQEIKTKFKMKRLMRDVKTLFSEQPNELQAIRKLDHQY